jgi:hypothetical protein
MTKKATSEQPMNKEAVNKEAADKQARLGLKIYLEFALLIVVLGGFNLYSYYKDGKRLFLIMGIVCIGALLGWTAVYFFYFKRNQ